MKNFFTLLFQNVRSSEEEVFLHISLYVDIIVVFATY